MQHINIIVDTLEISYDFDRWLESHWRKDTRLYSLSLEQNLYGFWMVTKTWGSGIRRGFGKAQDLVCLDYQAALKTYYELELKREKRGYKKIVN
jgi:hypothetical protein